MNLWLRSLNFWRGDEEASSQKLHKLPGNLVPTRNMCLLGDGLTPRAEKWLHFLPTFPGPAQGRAQQLPPLTGFAQAHRLLP